METGHVKLQKLQQQQQFFNVLFQGRKKNKMNLEQHEGEEV